MYFVFFGWFLKDMKFIDRPHNTHVNDFRSPLYLSIFLPYDNPRLLRLNRCHDRQ